MSNNVTFQNPFTGCPPKNSHVPDGVCCKNGRSITCRQVQTCDANGQSLLTPGVELEVCNASPNGIAIGGPGPCCNQLQVCPAPCVCPEKTDALLRPLEWPTFGQNAFGTSAAAPCQALLNTCNLHRLTFISSTELAIGGAAPLLVDVRANPTADDKYLYLTTQNQYGAGAPPTLVTTAGFLIKVERATGTVVWRRLISDYTNVPGDLSYSSPALWRQYIIIATGLQAPQTLLSGSFDFAGNYVNSLGGPIFVRGQPVSLLWIDRTTGDLVFQRFLGNPATDIYSQGNWSYVRDSPVVAQICAGDGFRTTVVAVGLTTSQGTLPFTYTLVGGVPADEEYLMGNNRFFRFSDVGQLYLFDIDDLNPLSGPLLVKNMAPGAPDISLPAEALVEGSRYFAKGEDTIAITVRVEFIRAELASGITNYIATPQAAYTDGCPHLRQVQQIRYLLRAGDPVPPPLVGQQTYDNLGALFNIPAGVVPANLDQATVIIDVEFEEANPGFFHLLAVPGTSYDSQDPANLPDNAVLKKFWRAVGFRLPLGSLFTTDQILIPDAYQASRFGYYGAGVEGTPAFNLSLCDGLARELYITTSNNQQVPFYEGEWIYGKFYTGPAPFPTSGYNLCTLPYLYRQALTAAASSASVLANTGDPFFTALDLKRKYVQRELARPLSLRGGANRHNAIVAINLRPDSLIYSVVGQASFGNVRKAQRVTAYSVNHLGFELSALRFQSTTGTAGDLVAVPGWTNIQQFYFEYRGSDSGFGAGPIVLKDVLLGDTIPSTGYGFCDQCQGTHRWGEALSVQTHYSEEVQVPQFVPPVEQPHNYVEVELAPSGQACCVGQNGNRVCCGVRPSDQTCCPKKTKKCLNGYYQCTQARQPAQLRDDLIVAAARGGEILVIQLKDTRVEQSYANYSLRLYAYAGNPGTIGGADYGIASDYCKVYSLQANAQSIPSFNRFAVGDYPPNFILTGGDTNSSFWWIRNVAGGRVAAGQSYLSAVNVVNGQIVWETNVNSSSGGILLPLVSSAAVGTTYLNPCSRNLVYLVGADRNVHFYDAVDGRDMRQLVNGNNGFDGAGPAKPIVIGKEVWFASGALATVPANDLPTRYLLKYQLLV